MPIDMTRIKANVAKMASMNAPPEDIDGYIASEGTTVDAVRAFNQPQYRGGAMSPANVEAQKQLGQAQFQSSPLGFFEQHPFLSTLQGLPEFITGTKAGDFVRSKQKGNPDPQEKKFRSMINMGADALDTFTSPGQWLTGIGLSKPVSMGIQGIKKGIGAIGKNISEVFEASKTLSETAKQIGSVTKDPKSILRQFGNLKQKEVMPLKDAIDSENTKIKDIQESIQKHMEDVHGLKSGKLELTKAHQDYIKETTMADLVKQKEYLQSALQKGSEGISKYMKEEIPKKIRSMNDVFGEHIDTISDAMEKSGKGISHADRFNILNATKAEAEDLGINTGRAKKLLDMLHDNATNITQDKEIPTGILDAEGKPIISKVSGQGSEMIPFREFIQETRQFRKILSDAKLTGVKGLNDEDIVGAIYNKNVNKYLEENVEGYRTLQKDYAPVIKTMKTARRIFKPGEDYNDETGVNLLKRYATDKTTEGKNQLFKDLESSSRFGEGMGSSTKNIKSIGTKISQVEYKISEMPKVLKEKFDTELENIKNGYDEDITSLKNKSKEYSLDTQSKIDSIKDQITEINNKYSERIEKIRAASDKLNEFKKKAWITGILGSIGLGGAGKAIEKAKEILPKL